MLSHRSGCTSLHPKIPKNDFEKIYSKMDEKELFDEIYSCDENYIDNPYYLLKSKNELKYEGEHITEEDKIKIFDEKTEKLLRLITEALEKHFDSTEMDQYLSSSIILDCAYSFFT